MSALYDKILREAAAQRASDPSIRAGRGARRSSSRADRPRPAVEADGFYDDCMPWQLARVIRADWHKPYFGAVPYIDALRACDDWDADYGRDSVESLVCYFRANAGTWRGPVARAVKAALLRRYPTR